MVSLPVTDGKAVLIVAKETGEKVMIYQKQTKTSQDLAMSWSIIYLIFFAFSLMVSSFTNMPFPLYGSGFRHARISAANCITTSLSIPSSNIRVG
jgi:hypothetical protein